MPAAPYIPATAVGQRDWMVNFAAQITADPAAAGLLPADAVIIQAAANAFDADFDLYGSIGNVAVNPATRTPAGVATLNSSRLAAIAIARPYAQTIRINPGVSDPTKVALGLNLPNSAPSPIPAPVSFPVLAFVGATPLQHTLRFADSVTPTQLGKKPFGVKGMQLFRTINATADPPPVNPEVALLVGVFTQLPLAVDFGAGDIGKRATYWARWVTVGRAVGGKQQQPGPWSAGLSATVLGA